MKFGLYALTGVLALTMGGSIAMAADEEYSPYGTAKVDMHEYPQIDTVFDVNYADPKSLNALYGFVRNTKKPLKGSVVVVTHGPELRAFAKENYEKYQSEMQRMAELADDGVEFRMCSNALLAAGYKPEDMHGFVTVVPAGFAEIAFLQSKGYQVLDPAPLPVRDVRYLDQPQLKK
ncbi:MAG: DsrE family protein [Burkholderiaceae bacterium]|nr:DsrE family protein [Burkholderiaceae bacterium]